jgi:hypothetical protein
MNDGRLSREEDFELRRLHVFRKFGVVANRLSGRYEELRSRDRRRAVREPTAQDAASKDNS